MAYTASARSALRLQLVTRILLPGNFDRGTVTSGTTSTVTISDLAYKYTNGHFDGGDIVLRAGTATAEIRKVVNYAGATGVMTVLPNWTTPPNASDAFEIYVAGYPVELMNQSLNDAVMAAHMKWPVPATDFQMVGEQARLFPIPTDWISVNRVMYGSRPISGSGHAAFGNTYYSTEKTVTATTQRLAQMIYMSEQVRWGEIWLPIRRIGTVTGTFNVKVYTNGSSVPSALLSPFGTSDDFTATLVDREMFWKRITFTSPPVTDGLVYYHFVIDPTNLVGLSASNYLAFGASTDQGYQWGAPSLSSDSGSTYTADSTFDRWFKIIPTAPLWEKIPWRSWGIVKSAIRQVETKYTLPIMTPIRLEGQKWQAAMTLDTDTCLLPQTWLLDLAAYSFLVASSIGNDGQLQLAKERGQRAAEYIASTPSIIYDRFVESF